MLPYCGSLKIRPSIWFSDSGFFGVFSWKINLTDRRIEMSVIHFKIEMFREYLEHELGILETIESWEGTCYFLDQLLERVKRFIADYTPMGSGSRR